MVLKKSAVIRGLSATAWMQSGARAVAENRKKVVVGFGIFILICGFMVSRIEVWDSWTSGFAKDSQVRQDIEKTNELFYGIHRLLLKRKSSEQLNTAEALGSLVEFENSLDELVKGKGGSYAFSEQLAYLNYAMHDRDKGYLRTGESPIVNDEILKYYEMVLGPSLLAERYHETSNSSLTSLFLRDPDYQKVDLLLQDIQEIISEDEMAIETIIGGDVSLSQGMIKAIVSTQVKSLLLSLTVIFLIALIYYRSFRFAFMTILAPSITILWLFAVMGIFQIPLGVATSMFASIIIGVGVDFFYSFDRRDSAG